jgi:magnesium transporter
MITTYYRAPDGAVQSPVSDDAMRKALASKQGLLWVDIESATQVEAAGLLAETFGFHPLAIDDCFNVHVDPAKVDDYGNYIFVIAQAIGYESSKEELETTELDLFLGSNYVVSFHSQPLPFVNDLRRRIDQDSPEATRGADFLAHALLDALVDAYQPAVDQLDDMLTRVEERVLARPDQSLLQEVLLLKHNVQRLRRTILPQRDVVNRISRGEFPSVIRSEMNIYFRDIYDHVVRVQELMESVRDLADGVLNTYLSSVNNRMNEVMKTLSVVATILLPLTFIASIYGMNFEHMPELTWHFGYFIVLGAMAAVAAGMVAFFRLRRWF